MPAFVLHLLSCTLGALKKGSVLERGPYPGLSPCGVLTVIACITLLLLSDSVPGAALYMSTPDDNLSYKMSWQTMFPAARCAVCGFVSTDVRDIIQHIFSHGFHRVRVRGRVLEVYTKKGKGVSTCA